MSLAPGDAIWLAQLGSLYALTGDEAKARGIVHDLEETGKSTFVSPYHLAYVHAGLGEHDRAIDLLEQAVRTRTGPAYGIGGSFLYEPLRRHPRFVALLREMGLA